MHKAERVALVGPISTRTSLGKYCSDLYPELSNVFPETREFRWWQDGYNCETLPGALLEYDPDLVIIEHSFGLFPNVTAFAAMLSRVRQLRVVARMHSVYQQDAFQFYEQLFPEILVHNEEQKEVLSRRVSSKIYVIPHGISNHLEGPAAEFQGKKVLVQFGFGLPYKGWQTTLQVADKLKDDFPDLLTILIMSRGEGADLHEYELLCETLRRSIEELHLQDRAFIWRGFFLESQLHTTLRGASVALFPYVDYPFGNVFAASGAARTALACGVPVVTSKVPIFADLAPHLRQGHTTAEIAEGVASALREGKTSSPLLTECSWQTIAQLHREIF